MSPFDPYLSSQVLPNNPLTHLYNYSLNRLRGGAPGAPLVGVPNPTTPYRGVGGNYVGMDTSPGSVGRNIDLEKIGNQISSDYVGVDPTKQQVVTHDDQQYVIGKDQKVVGDQVLDKDAPTGLGRWFGGAIDAVTGNKWDHDKRDSATLIGDAQTTREKTQTDRFLEQNQLNQAIHQSQQGMYNQWNRNARTLANQIGEDQMARDLNYLKQSYPIAQAAAWDATNRALYGDRYSASAAQRREREGSLSEAAMYGAVAQQANAAANMRGSYRGRNVGFG
tara:strand:- start:948 stop:1781 length:834 start_codon:yes stop_codon:yes gene_type:complete